MKYLILNITLRLSYLCLVCLICILFTSNVNAQDFDLKNYLWRKRVLIVFTVDAQNERFKQQMAALKEGEKGFDDRDLVVVAIFAQSGLDEKSKPINVKKAIVLRKKYAISDNEFKVILIGKDGRAKKTTTRAFDNQQLFNIIDAMPMRKDEVKKER